MTSNEIRQKFLKFFENHGHKIIPSASLIPENDPSVLFTTAGMQPLVPYLLGQKHPMGTRLVDVQKCVRTGDIDEVGDNRHCTFFEMLGNWSLGDYFKEEAIKWSFEFLTDKDEGLGLDINRIYVTVFEGNDDAPCDNEAAEIWKKYLPEGRVYFLPAKNNWWSVGENGPCGPDTEIFYDVNEIALGDLSHDEFVKADDEGNVIEIWNNVFMQFEKKDGKVIGKLAQHNVDTGMGFERIVMVKQGVKTVFDTDLFSNALKVLEDHLTNSSGNYTDKVSFEEIVKAKRIYLDHFRTALFLASDGVIPSGKGQGYIMRRLIRKGSLYFFQKISPLGFIVNPKILDAFVLTYEKQYPELLNLKNNKYQVILDEVEKFGKTMDLGLKEFDKGVDPFILVTTYGLPLETVLEIYKEKNKFFDIEDYNKKMVEHQKLSQTASAGMFKGGLADAGEETKRLHTATHLLNAALKQVLGNQISQKGSNINAERLRFDFSYPEKLTDEQKKEVEDIVNQKIEEKLPVGFVEMPKEQAEKIAAHSFNEKYGDVVKVYSIGDEKNGYFSREFCGGPHVENTSELGHFKIQKEEAVAAGVRRIKATLE